MGYRFRVFGMTTTAVPMTAMMMEVEVQRRSELEGTTPRYRRVPCGTASTPTFRYRDRYLGGAGSDTNSGDDGGHSSGSSGLGSPLGKE